MSHVAFVVDPKWLRFSSAIHFILALNSMIVTFVATALGANGLGRIITITGGCFAVIVVFMDGVVIPKTHPITEAPTLRKYLVATSFSSGLAALLFAIGQTVGVPELYLGDPSYFTLWLFAIVSFFQQVLIFYPFFAIRRILYRALPTEERAIETIYPLTKGGACETCWIPVGCNCQRPYPLPVPLLVLGTLICALVFDAGVTGDRSQLYVGYVAATCFLAVTIALDFFASASTAKSVGQYTSLLAVLAWLAGYALYAYVAEEIDAVIFSFQPDFMYIAILVAYWRQHSNWHPDNEPQWYQLLNPISDKSNPTMDDSTSESVAGQDMYAGNEEKAEFV